MEWPLATCGEGSHLAGECGDGERSSKRIRFWEVSWKRNATSRKMWPHKKMSLAEGKSAGKKSPSRKEFEDF